VGRVLGLSLPGVAWVAVLRVWLRLAELGVARLLAELRITRLLLTELLLAGVARLGVAEVEVAGLRLAWVRVAGRFHGRAGLRVTVERSSEGIGAAAAHPGLLVVLVERGREDRVFARPVAALAVRVGGGRGLE
jgi:hypothetical protein